MMLNQYSICYSIRKTENKDICFVLITNVFITKYRENAHDNYCPHSVTGHMVLPDISKYLLLPPIMYSFCLQRAP